MTGCVNIKRNIAVHWMSSNPYFMAVWIRLIAEANFKDEKKLINGSTVKVKTGDLIFGLISFSKRSGVTVSKLRQIIKILTTESMISIVNFNKYSIISITNYGLYQTDRTQTARRPHADRTQTASEKEKKAVKEKKDSLPKEKSTYVDTKKPSLTSKGRLPEDWSLSSSCRASAKSYWNKKSRNDLDADDQAELFSAHHHSRGTAMINWDAAWRTWYCKAVQFNERPPNGKGFLI